MGALTRHSAAFAKLTGLSTTLYLRGFCIRLIESTEDGTHYGQLPRLERQISTFESLCREVCLLHDRILLISGFAQELYLIQQTIQQISHVVQCLEDLWCSCAEGGNVLKMAYEKQTLLYQKDNP